MSTVGNNLPYCYTAFSRVSDGSLSSSFRYLALLLLLLLLITHTKENRCNKIKINGYREGLREGNERQKKEEEKEEKERD